MDDKLKENLQGILDAERGKDAENIWETMKSAYLIAEDIFGENPTETAVFKVYQCLRIEEGIRELSKSKGADYGTRYKQLLTLN